MPAAPFLKPIRLLVDELETISSSSPCFKHQLCILAYVYPLRGTVKADESDSEIAGTALRELTAESEAEDVAYDERLLNRVKVLERVLGDARDSARQIGTRHFLRVLWTREDPSFAISAQFDAMLEDIQALQLGLGIQSSSIAARTEAAHAADESQRQNLLLAATRDHAMLDSLLQLDKCSPIVVVAAMKKVSLALLLPSQCG